MHPSSANRIISRALTARVGRGFIRAAPSIRDRTPIPRSYYVLIRPGPDRHRSRLRGSIAVRRNCWAPLGTARTDPHANRPIGAHWGRRKRIRMQIDHPARIAGGTDGSACKSANRRALGTARINPRPTAASRGGITRRHHAAASRGGIMRRHHAAASRGGVARRRHAAASRRTRYRTIGNSTKLALPDS